MLQLAAGMAANGVVGCTAQSEAEAEAASASGFAPWPNDIAIPVVDHPGYGMYPDYAEIGETGPWPKILSNTHRRALEVFSDIILPGTDTAPSPSAIGIGDFWDDWTSAPYPWMNGTRTVVHQGFAWLDAQMQIDHGAGWLGASDSQRKFQVSRMRKAAASGEDGPLRPAGEMYRHLRQLVIGAYYTTPEGEADLGHIDPQVTGEDYAGPTGEALDHILGLIEELGLETADLPIGPPPYDVTPYRYTADNPS